MAGRCLQCRQRSGFSYLPLWKSTFLSVFQLLRALREVGQGLNLKRGVRASRRLSWPGLGWPELAGKVTGNTGKLAWNLQNNKTGEFFFPSGDTSGCRGRFWCGRDKAPMTILSYAPRQATAAGGCREEASSAPPVLSFWEGDVWDRCWQEKRLVEQVLSVARPDLNLYPWSVPPAVVRVE